MGVATLARMERTINNRKIPGCAPTVYQGGLEEGPGGWSATRCFPLNNHLATKNLSPSSSQHPHAHARGVVTCCGVGGEPKATNQSPNQYFCKIPFLAFFGHSAKFSAWIECLCTCREGSWRRERPPLTMLCLEARAIVSEIPRREDLASS